MIVLSKSMPMRRRDAIRSARIPASALRERRTIGLGPSQRLDPDPMRRVSDSGKALDPLRLGVGMGHAHIVSGAIAIFTDREFARLSARLPFKITAFPFRHCAQREQIMRHGGEAGV